MSSARQLRDPARALTRQARRQAGRQALARLQTAFDQGELEGLRQAAGEIHALLDVSPSDSADCVPEAVRQALQRIHDETRRTGWPLPSQVQELTLQVRRWHDGTFDQADGQRLK